MRYLLLWSTLLLASCSEKPQPQFQLEAPGSKALSIRFDEREYSLQRNEQKPYRVLARMEDGSESDVTTVARVRAGSSNVLLLTYRSMSGLEIGTSGLEAQYEGLKAHARVEVEIPPVIRFRLQPDPVQLRVISVGESVAYRAVALRADGSEEDVSHQARWRSSDGAIVTAAAGELRGASPGKASVAVAYEGFSDGIELVVAP